MYLLIVVLNALFHLLLQQLHHFLELELLLLNKPFSLALEFVEEALPSENGRLLFKNLFLDGVLCLGKN